MKLIQQSMLIRDTADNIYTALTSREDLQQWWGTVNPDADGTSTWYGMDRQYEVPIVAAEPGKLLSFAFDSHHPYDEARTEPTTISITIAEEGNVSIVTVVQSMFTDDDWNTLIHDGWVYSLLSLQLWVERGIAYSQWTNEKKFHTVKKAVALKQDAVWAWNALTRGRMMGDWLDANATSDPILGGQIALVRDEQPTIAGEWTLLSQPRNLICHMWDDQSLADHDDPGPITVQQWTILPAVNGSVVSLTEYGYELGRVKKSEIRRIEARWDKALEKLQQLSEQAE